MLPGKETNFLFQLQSTLARRRLDLDTIHVEIYEGELAETENSEEL